MELAIHHEGGFDAGAFDAGAFDAGAFDAGAFDAGAFDVAETLARADLDRVPRDLAEQREPVRGDLAGTSLAALVAASDAHLWAKIDSRRSAHE